MRAVYISPTPGDQATANTLGLGFILDPSSTAHALIQGNGATVVLPAPVTLSQVTSAEAPILAAEAATDAANATANTNLSALLAKAANAIANNLTYLAIGSPTNAQVVAQVNALTLQVDALIRVVANQLSSQSGT